MNYIFIQIETIFFFILILLLVLFLFAIYIKRKECNLTMIFNIQLNIICLLHISSLFFTSGTKNSTFCKIQAALVPSSIVGIVLLYDLFIMTSFIMLKYPNFLPTHITLFSIIIFSLTWVGFILLFISCYISPTYFFQIGYCITNSKSMRIIITSVCIFLIIFGFIFFFNFLIELKQKEQQEKNEEYGKRFSIIMITLILMLIMFIISIFIVQFKNKNDYHFFSIFLQEINNISIIIGLGYNKNTIVEIKALFCKKKQERNTESSSIILTQSEEESIRY